MSHVQGVYSYNYGCISMPNVVLFITKCVAPYMVATSMIMRGVSFMVPDPVNYARTAVATIGIKKFTHGYVSHAIQVHC